MAILASAALATEIDEDRFGDAGSLPPSALPATGTGPLERIKGRLSESAALGVDDFEDMYLIRIVDADGFSARTVFREDEVPFDTQLWLFDACGFGQVGNDDDPDGPAGIGFSILLPAADDGTGFVLPGPGLYYLAISGKGRVPVSAGGEIFDLDDPFEISGADGPGGGSAISDWIGVGEVGAYQIELTGCAFLGAGFADLNGDGTVGGADLGMLLDAWGSDDPVADLNGDGVVNGADLGLLLDAWGPAPPPHSCGDEGSGDCFVANGTPYCDDVCCCTLVCDVDPFCCETTWDGLCASGAAELCVSDPESLECPEGATIESEVCGEDLNGGCNAALSPSDCCVANGTPGCDDPDCEALVCSVDPFCCDTQWDAICAGQAVDLCERVCEPTIHPFDELACGVTICGTAWAEAGIRDTDWFEVTFTGPVEVTFTGTALFPLVIGIVDTGGIPDCDLASSLSPFALAEPLETVAFTAKLDAGTYWFFVAVNGFDGVPCGSDNDYVVTLDAAGGACDADGCGTPRSGSCFEANGSPFCDDELCCEFICARDPFCCDVTWDIICADAALSICMGSPPCPGDLNGDGVVDLDDLLLLQRSFGPCPPGEPCPADLNGDGVVDAKDQAILISLFGPC